MEPQPITQSVKYNYFLIGSIVLLTILIVGGGVYFLQKSTFSKRLQEQAQQAQKENEELQQRINELQNQIAQLQAQEETSTPSPKSQLYENQYLKVTIPAGWIATQATQNPAAVNITKANYILYINTQAQQASGIIGGRFSEISVRAPSADAVIKVHPSGPCGFSETHPGFANHPRVDLYVNNQEKRSWCATPSNGSTVWYFSYITDSQGNYFNYYKEGEPLSFVITMAYNSGDVNKLPVKGDAALNAMLDEMTAIIKTLEIKQK